MSIKASWLVWSALLCSASPTLFSQQANQQWSESQVIELFLSQSPQSRELRARVALVEAEARARTVYSNPSVSYSRETAGYNEFFEASQILPINGRMRYLREAGTAAVSVAEANRAASLWSMRSDLRVAFHRMLTAQERSRLLTSETGEVDQLIRILRKREEEGEGSRYDRMRAEREVAELHIDITAARAATASAAARLSVFLPEGTRVREVRGELATTAGPPEVEALIRLAMIARADFRVEQRNVARYQIEEQGARRLRIPEPQITAGLKRADETSGIPPNPLSNVARTGVAFSLSVPLPIFNDGRYEVARYQAEQGQANARMEVLVRQIRAEIQGAVDALRIRREALVAYQHEIESSGIELTRIAQVAYQEGEIGILELLDSLRLSRNANLRALDLQAGVKEAFIELERVVGEEVRP